MNTYLLAEKNRDDIVAHNSDLMVTTVKTIGKASYTSYDFNRPEEYKQLDIVLGAPDAETQSLKAVTQSVFGTDDDVLLRRTRGNLSFGSTYQKTQVNGRAVIAQADGTLFFTHNADEYGDLVEENTAKDVAATGRYVERKTNRMNKNLLIAVDKVPQLEQRVGDTREHAADALKSVFDIKLALLRG
jgi:hypothetical protein